MANPFDFSSGAILTAAQLNSIGDFESFTPAWNSVTEGNATNNGKFCQVNELVFYQIFFDAGSTTSYSAGNISLDISGSSLPAAVQDGAYISSGTGWVRPIGGTIWFVHNIVISSSQTILPYLLLAAGSLGYSHVSSISNARPTTWDTSGEMYLQGFYRAA